jgi:acetyl-CoA acetyltransferase
MPSASQKSGTCLALTATIWSSQQRANEDCAEGRFETQLVPVELPDGTTMARDEGLREITLEGLAGLKPTGRPDDVHSAGTLSEIPDGASAILLMTRAKAEKFRLVPLATVVDVTFVGCDPVRMLEDPIPATCKLLNDNELTIDSIDVIELNEAVAAVVLAFEQELNPIWPK